MDKSTFGIPENYDLPYSKLKAYLAEWFPFVEISEPNPSGSGETVKLVRLDDKKVMFSRPRESAQAFGDNSIVGTREIADKELSMIINQIIGMDIALEKMSAEQNDNASEQSINPV